jgi:hypothetical protein
MVDEFDFAGRDAGRRGSLTFKLLKYPSWSQRVAADK